MATKQFAAAAAAAAPVCLGAKKVPESSIIASKQNAASASVRPRFLPAAMLNEPRFTYSIPASRHESSAVRASQLPHVVKAQIQDRKVSNSVDAKLMGIIMTCIVHMSISDWHVISTSRTTKFLEN